MAALLRQAARFSSSGSLSQLSASARHGRVNALAYFGSNNRNSSTSSKIKVDLDSNTGLHMVFYDKVKNPPSGIAVVKFQSPPVNSMSMDFLTEFSIHLEKLELDKSCRGFILTSAVPRVFSAGLDIMDMYGKSPEHCEQFWRALQDVWIKLYGSSKIVIAGINGSSPAGGCLMSLCCDYRIMADNPRYSIGLNETQLGIVAPFWFVDTMVNAVGYRVAELSVQFGLMHNSAEALKIGVVDQLVPEDQVLSTAIQTMTKWFAIPDHARQISKSMLRKPTLEKMVAKREADIKNFAGFITRDSIQKSLGMYMAMLKQKKG